MQAALPWLGLALAILALAALAMALWRTIAQSQIYRGRMLSIVLGAFTMLVSGANLFIFFHARALPDSATAPQVGQQAPDFTLADSSGQSVSLDSLLASPAADPSSPAPKAVLLIFYRGYW
jgi:hypothetical protein